jgi:hypothetical protein
MKRSIHLALAALALGAAAAVSATPTAAQTAQRSVTVVPDEEKRSRITEVIATVPIPAEMRPKPSAAQMSELRESAVQQAKQMALWRVSDELKAKPAPAGLVIRPPDGVDAVNLIGLRDLPSDSADEMRILVKAEVRYRLERAAGSPETPPTPGPKTDPSDPVVLGCAMGSGGAPPDQGATALMSQEAPLTVRVCTERKIYKDGEPLVILVSGNRDFYGRIDYEDVQGTIIKLLPNEFRADSLFKAGTEYRVPGEGDKFRLIVKEPFGPERIIVFASITPLGPVPTQPIADGLAKIETSREDAAQRTRSVTIEPTEPRTTGGTEQPETGGDGSGGTSPTTTKTDASTPRPPSVDFIEATWEITTEAR